MTELLSLAARYGRLLLISGLVAGFALPGLAAALRPWLPEMIAALLFLAALRIGPRGVMSALGQLRETLAMVLLIQLALPLAVAGGLASLGLAGTPAGMAAILVTTASSIAGSPNLSIMTGGDPAPALRLLVLGTALLPLTVLPVFLLAGFEATGIGAASARLTALILAASAVAFLLHRPLMRGSRAVEAVDGLSAIMMMVLVVGLMTAVSQAVWTTPLRFLRWLAFAAALNFGLQLAAAALLRRSPLAADTIPMTIVAGNRNVALFLVALPEQVTTPLLVFIGCYQVPMYLTPLVMSRLLR